MTLTGNFLYGKPHGEEEGDECNRKGCEGVLEYQKVENCCCHMGNPPCSACTDVLLECPKCYWNEEEE
jgi:hypothetical protein